MYISAHRVQAPPHGEHQGPQGINAFYYKHGPRQWQGVPPDDFLPESNPGVFVDASIEVAPPGNTVRSFLDIVAPDDARLPELIAAVSAPPPVVSLPASWVVGNVWCRFGTEAGLAAQWRRELQRLFARIELLWREQDGRE